MVVALLLFCLGLTGAGMIVAGVYLLAGGAWALMAGGVGLVCVAAFLRRGLTNE